MTTLRVVPDPEDNLSAQAAQTQFYDVLDSKAWDVLGLTGEEFKRRWHAGEYQDDPRPAVQALDTFMRTGEWQVAG